MADLNSKTILEATQHLRNVINATSSSIDKLTVEVKEMSKSTTKLGTKANWIAGLCALAAIAQAVAAVAALVK